MSRPRNFGASAVARALAEARSHDPVLRRMYGLPLLPMSSLPPSPPEPAMEALKLYFEQGDYEGAVECLRQQPEALNGN